MEFFLLALLALGVLLSGVVAFFMGLGTRTRLQLLEQKVVSLQARLALPGPAGTGMAPAPAAAPTEEAASQPAPDTEAPAVPDETTTSEPFAAAAPDAATEPDGEPIAASPPSQPAPAAPPAAESFEERFGTRWVVWVGGLALALGAIFLVRYSIEQGLLGPGVRVFLGAVFAAALIGAGEWARRQENLSGLPGLPQASIPAILTAAGTTAAYATVYAAHALYGFVGPGPAFILLGIVALATLAAALLHGPALAGLGLVGAYVTPLLVASPEPNFWALYLYLVAVTAAAFALARMRLWRWLAVTAIALSVAWLLPGLGVVTYVSAASHAFYVVAGFALAAVLIVSGLAYGPAAEPDTVDEISSGALAAFLVGATLLVVASGHATSALIAFVLLIAATIAIAWRAPAATAAVPVAAACAALVIAEWAVGLRVENLVAPGGPTAPAVPDPAKADVGLQLAVGFGLAVLFGAAGYLVQGRAERPVIPLLWAGSAVLAPILILIALYYRVAGFERSIPFAALALLYPALYATATELLGRRQQRPGLASAQALFAVGAVASLALALTLALEKGWLTVALALMAPGIAMVANERPLPLLRWLAAACAAVVSARLAWNPQVVSDLGTTPVFNWLLWGYGVPAAAFWTAGHLLRRRADDVPARMVDAAAVLFTVLTVTLEIRHYAGNGDIYAVNEFMLGEIGMHVTALLAIAIGLERVRARTQNPVHDAGALVTAGLAFAAIVFLLLISENPLWNPVPVGGLLFNLILLSYGIPAILVSALALITRQTRSRDYWQIAAAVAVVLALAYLTLQVRRFYQGPVLDGSAGPTTEAELWTYSVVWLAFGVLLLLAGIALRSQPARLASAAVILVTVVKVFLSDLAGLGGIWRALSFIGLGLVLVGIGLLYQRLLFPQRPPPAPAGGVL